MGKQLNGWIYVLDDQQGHYKIGKTIVLTERIKQLKIQIPFYAACQHETGDDCARRETSCGL